MDKGLWQARMNNDGHGRSFEHRKKPNEENKHWCLNCGLITIRNLSHPQCPYCGASIENDIDG